ncbi:MAG TPA: hypothetical protein VFF27_02645 [Bacteroidia bacterium]|jgi:hypothetical protein|nr:hypothetical protein [Bacteroidia bacterium]
MIRKFLTFLFVSIIGFQGFAQEPQVVTPVEQPKPELKDDLTRLKNGEDLNVLYRNEASFGAFIHSAAGIGIAYRRGKHITAKRKHMYEIETQNFKHPKEIKSINPYFEDAKGFVYGKLNSLLIIRPGLGIQNILYQKSDKKSVEIRYSYFIGAALAFAKPVYLEVRDLDGTADGPISVERYDPQKHSIDEIFGKAPFFKGIEKTTIYPGGYAKFALSFEYADRYNGLKAIETGATLDVYPRVIPIMAFNKNQQVFVSLYLKMIWGKKWF